MMNLPCNLTDQLRSSNWRLALIARHAIAALVLGTAVLSGCSDSNDDSPDTTESPSAEQGSGASVDGMDTGGPMTTAPSGTTDGETGGSAATPTQPIGPGTAEGSGELPNTEDSTADNEASSQTGSNGGADDFGIEQNFDFLSDEIGVRTVGAMLSLNRQLMDGSLAEPLANCVDPATNFPVLSFPADTAQCRDQPGGFPTLASLGFPARTAVLVDEPTCRDPIVESFDASACRIGVVNFTTSNGYFVVFRPKSAATENGDVILRATTNEGDFEAGPNSTANQPGAGGPSDPAEASGCIIRYARSSGDGIFLPSDEARCDAVVTDLLRAVRSL